MLRRDLGGGEGIHAVFCRPAAGDIGLAILLPPAADAEQQELKLKEKKPWPI
jgi:hypothetical protein